jgi:hypothetical protein
MVISQPKSWKTPGLSPKYFKIPYKQNVKSDFKVILLQYIEHTTKKQGLNSNKIE